MFATLLRRVCPSIMMLAALLVSASLMAQQPPADAESPADSATPAATEQPNADRQKLYDRFTEMMSGVKMVGRFTVVGKEGGPLAEEQYEIKSVRKLPNGDYWLITARIKYGEHDLTLPLPLEVKWSGTTPVITLDELMIPGLGTFSARVLVDAGKYAGTWSHGPVGGHLFGTVEKLATEDKEADDKESQNAQPEDNN